HHRKLISRPTDRICSVTILMVSSGCECAAEDMYLAFEVDVIPRGAVATFATEATGFSQAFPGIRPHLLTLSSNFNIPFYREAL
ncbi:unnamed protein product, partial [Mycena citricolor]